MSIYKIVKIGDESVVLDFFTGGKIKGSPEKDAIKICQMLNDDESKKIITARGSGKLKGVK